MGYVRKEDVDEAVTQESVVWMFHKFLGINDTMIACVYGITPRTHITSTYYQAQVVISELCNKRFTTNSLKSLALPPATSAPVSSTKSNLAWSITITNSFRSKNMKDLTSSSIKKNFCRSRSNYSKPVKVKKVAIILLQHSVRTHESCVRSTYLHVYVCSLQ